MTSLAEAKGALKGKDPLVSLVWISGTNRAFSAPFTLLIPRGEGGRASAMGGHWAGQCARAHGVMAGVESLHNFPRLGY